MGLSALTMRGWKNNPRGEGRSHLVIAIIFIILISTYDLIWGEWNDSATVFCIVIAIWGVFGFCMGELSYWLNKKNK